MPVRLVGGFTEAWKSPLLCRISRLFMQLRAQRFSCLCPLKHWLRRLFASTVRVVLVTVVVTSPTCPVLTCPFISPFVRLVLARSCSDLWRFFEPPEMVRYLLVYSSGSARVLRRVLAALCRSCQFEPFSLCPRFSLRVLCAASFPSHRLWQPGRSVHKSAAPLLFVALARTPLMHRD